MGEMQDKLYALEGEFGEADVLGRKILRGGVKLFKDCYRYKGQVYWIVAGRVLTREQAERLEQERQREGRTRLEREMR